MTSNNAPNLVGGPLRAGFKNGSWYIDTDSPERLGDTVYVECTSSSKGYAANADLFYRRVAGNDASRESGSFYTGFLSYLCRTYAEACFIKAEVLFNQGINQKLSMLTRRY